jgi:hypothetical protein
MKKPCTTIPLTVIALIMILSACIAPLAQTPRAAYAQIQIFSRVLQDDPVGHALGWDPDGSTHTFNIIEPEFNASTDMVFINTVQDNFIVCSVDYRWVGSFEVNCIETTSGYLPSGNITVLEGGPDNGAGLYYTVVSGLIIPSRSPPPSDALPEGQNVIAERMRGDRSP